MNTRKMFNRFAMAATVYGVPTATMAGLAAYAENQRQKELMAAQKAGATLVERFQPVPGFGGYWRAEVVKPKAESSNRGVPFRTGF